MNSSPVSYAAALHRHDAILYIDSTLPLGATLAEYRRSRPTRPTRWQRLSGALA